MDCVTDTGMTNVGRIYRRCSKGKNMIIGVQLVNLATMFVLVGMYIGPCKTQSFLHTPNVFPVHRILYDRQSAQATLPRRTFYDKSLSAVTKNDQQQQQSDEWLSLAMKLREEVRELEAAASISRQGKTLSDTSSKNAVEYTDVANSVWILAYRFANDPEETNATNDDSSRVLRRLFGGKVTVKYRQDGYTDIISQESYGSSTESCKVIKAWGWDIELSKDNENDSDATDQEYILFSIDVELPPIKGGSTTKERFYFQARKDTDARTGIISLVDGTVTVKRDIVQKSTRWGLFSSAGILAQFRYVGGYVAKPAQVPETA